jgi:hypothetical protein
MSLFGPDIQGVEVTQAIQYYSSGSHLTDPADRQPDNAVTQVANKPAWVRVYVRGSWLFSPARVTGELTVKRRVFGWLWSTLGTLAPRSPGFVIAFDDVAYATERGNPSFTLNFVIPARMMCGDLRLDVRVERRLWFFTISTSRRVYIDVTLRQTLRLAGIMVGYNGPSSSAPGAPNLTLAAPTLGDLQTTSAWTLQTFPVRSAATYRTAGTITWNLPLTDAPSCSGCCTPNWVALNAAVQAVRIADGNHTDVLYYGLLASGIPMGPIVGCNSGGVSTGSVGQGVTMAHELGHACGRPHSPCGTPGDPLYPAYEPSDPAGTPTASIGEYGLDINTGTVMSPAMFKDFMSYCGPRWISLFVTGRLTNNAMLDPARACVSWPWWDNIILSDRMLIPKQWLPDPPADPPWLVRDVAPEPLISLIGVQNGPDDIEIRSVFRLQAEGQVQNGRALDLRAELVDSEGRVLASGTVYSLRSSADGGCGCTHDDDSNHDHYPRLIQSFIADAAPGAELRIRRGEEVLWGLRGAPRPPTLSDVTAELDGDLRLTWAIDPKGEQESECWVQWSADDGVTWRGLAANLRGGSAIVDARGLPAGPVVIRLLVSDGFHTATSEPIALSAAPRRPEASILSPRDGQTVPTPGSLRLWGLTASGGEDVPDELARWLIDGKQVATGLDVFVDTPAPGDHTATLEIRDPEGEAVASVQFKVAELAVDRDEEARSQQAGAVRGRGTPRA